MQGSFDKVLATFLTMAESSTRQSSPLDLRQNFKDRQAAPGELLVVSYIHGRRIRRREFTDDFPEEQQRSAHDADACACDLSSNVCVWPEENGKSSAIEAGASCARSTFAIRQCKPSGNVEYESSGYEQYIPAGNLGFNPPRQHSQFHQSARDHRKQHGAPGNE